ncbi:aspartyl-tRNA(Asn)/glutamyl-tRNA(Gln) amidotransferase subunit A [Bradyrhizobium elkanii]
MSVEFDTMSATEMRRRVATKEISPVELTNRALEKADATQSTLNAFYLLMPDKALAAARKAESAVIKGAPLGPIHGVPFSAKDLIAAKGVGYASGSLTMKSNVASVDAPAVERAKAGGGILIGKTTTSEFGCKPVGDNRLTGITRHPWNLGMTPGGSSAGAAASVAAGITPFALGTDGGGSIRIPAAFCGLAGLKGQFGRVPVWPTSATPTLAHVGPLARTIEDVALLFSVVAGFDSRDPFSIARPVPDVIAALAQSVAGMKVAYSPTLGYARPNAEVVRLTDQAAETLRSLGCQVDIVEKVFDSDPADLWTAEFYAGVGSRLRFYMEHQRDLLDPAVANVLEPALTQSMHDYYTKVFSRYALRDTLRSFFERYDALISPVLPVTALEVGKDMPRRTIGSKLGHVGVLYVSFQPDRTARSVNLRRHRNGRNASRTSDRRKVTQ